MKVFFVNPPYKWEFGKYSRDNRSPAITKSGTVYYPLWLIYAAAVCENEQFEVEFLDAPAKPWGLRQSLEYIAGHVSGTRLFVINTSTPSIYSDVEFSEKLKDLYPDAFIVLVGTHPSALPEETLRISDKVDAVAVKEFDYTIRDLAFAIDRGTEFSEVDGLVYRNNGDILHNRERECIEDLDEIPFSSKFVKEHLDEKDYFFSASSYPEIQVFTGRGCTARCNFCVYPQTMHGHRYRFRSPENVVAEFEYIAQNFPDVKEIVIEDDTFTSKKSRVVDICNLLIQKGLHKRFKWLCNARVNLDFETMKIMKKAGCRLIIPGIESGSQFILNNIKKGTTVKQIEEYVKNSKRAGLLIHACYMVGNKGETHETMQHTLDMALQLNTDTAQFYPLIPYPGTEAYDWAKSNGYIRGKYDEYCKPDGSLNCIINLPDVSSKQLVDFCDYARRKYYLRPSYILHRLALGLTDPSDLQRSIKAFGNIRKFLFRK